MPKFKILFVKIVDYEMIIEAKTSDDAWSIVESEDFKFDKTQALKTNIEFVVDSVEPTESS